MQFLLGLLGILVMAPSVLGTTTVQPATTTNKMLNSFKAAFHALDTNHDNVIEFSELVTIFHGADTNNDSKMSLQEYAVYTQIPIELVKVIFDEIDPNKDHFVDKKEFDRIFNMFDVNDNGYISETEFVNAYTKIYQTALKALNLAVGK